MNRNRNSRNFGFGKKMGFAIQQALIDRYGAGRQFGTVAAHKARMKPFVGHLEKMGLNDLRQADATIVSGYAQHVADQVSDEVIAIKTGKNRISSMNVVLGHMRGDGVCFIMPAQALGRLSSVRREPPAGIQKEKVDRAVGVLKTNGYLATADAVEFARKFGLRIREAALMDITRVIREAERSGLINIIEGTKGGRKLERLVPVDEEGFDVLLSALQSHKGGKLIGRALGFQSWYQKQYYRYRCVAHEAGLTTKFHDLRAAWACCRYKEESGFDAPVVTGGRVAPRDLDLFVRNKLALELGHSRAQILGSYIGGVREPQE